MKEAKNPGEAGRVMDPAGSMDTSADTTFSQVRTYYGIRNTAVSIVSSIRGYMGGRSIRDTGIHVSGYRMPAQCPLAVS